MLNAEGGRIVVGIAFDRDLQGYAVSGCSCSDRNELKVLDMINEKCHDFADSVAVKVHPCGIILDNKCRLVSNLKM